jgi:hypothetical protein
MCANNADFVDLLTRLPLTGTLRAAREYLAAGALLAPKGHPSDACSIRVAMRDSSSCASDATSNKDDNDNKMDHGRTGDSNDDYVIGTNNVSVKIISEKESFSRCGSLIPKKF